MVAMTEEKPVPSVAELDAVLAENFSPWVLDLGLRVLEAGPRHATLLLPWSDRLAREGGTLSGQAMMAAADTATVIAVTAARGGYVQMATVQQSTTFQLPVLGEDLLVRAEITKLGRVAFTDIVMTVTHSAHVVARASTVYMLLG